ncbi:hypothetical protein A2617_02585 [Candidatus Daviesbacteria bacterium RIFOXYD1_FULL_41_10]|uniref:Uncharacterized protein n=2 Tax=Patescibacteria group TaxID=1783273 RepID=A0A1F5N0D3_9BACT|nr:MAG: hypothetical protein UW78_C0017G0012 [Candidatus Azambacteria bacterium GW2011_GWA1_44_9]OGE71042.1 MAG: hypothetical protein A2617_02585 [Candidatus Daviesbacteria bacterium RIFOXYD1_FULL_41_10]
MKKSFRIKLYFFIGCAIFALLYVLQVSAFSATKIYAQQICTLQPDEYPQCGGTCNGISYPDTHTVYVHKRVNEWDCEYYWECSDMGDLGQCGGQEQPTPTPYYPPEPTPTPYYPSQPTPTPYTYPTPTPYYYYPTPTPPIYFYPTPTPYYPPVYPTPTPYYPPYYPPVYPTPTPYFPPYYPPVYPTPPIFYPPPPIFPQPTSVVVLVPLPQPQQQISQITVEGSRAEARAQTGQININVAGAGGQQAQIPNVPQLPKTGLPEGAWLLSSLLPVGVGLRRFGNGIKPAGSIGRFLWRRREFLKK